MPLRSPIRTAIVFTLLVIACSPTSEEEELFDADRCNDPGVSCQAYGRAAGWQNKPPAYELGDGTSPPTIRTVHQSTVGWDPVDLEFNPRSPRDLWIINKATGHMTVVKNVGSSQAQVIERRDPAYAHFMNKPPALAMAGTHPQFGQLWATCGDGDNGGNYFMGPTLYSAELTIFGGNNPTTNLGSHLDMLHSTPFCRGIAWAGTGNQYFVFNSFSKAIDFYDFKQDHGIGWDDHSDGVVRRFWNTQVKGVAGVESHLSWNNEEKKLYVADTGNKRILMLDPAGAQRTAPMQGLEVTAERAYYETPVKVAVSNAILEQPSGVESSGGLIFVTDAKTSKIHAFKTSDGSLVKTLDTGLPSGSLAGLNFGPDGKIYFVDRKAAKILRVDP